MGQPNSSITFGIPFASADGKYYSRYPMGNAIGTANASGALAAAVASRLSGVAASIAGTTYYAAIGGSADPAHGSFAAPWSFDYAVTRLQPGDTLRVMGVGPFIWGGACDWEGGAFNPTNNGTPGAPITIISHVPRQAVIRSPQPGVTPAIGLVRKNYIHFKDFTVYGTVKARGANDNTGNNPNMMRGIVFDGLDVYEGDIEGGDTSLKWGICFQWIRDSAVRNCRVQDLTELYSDGENTSGIGIFDSTDNVFENNWVDATNVHAGIGFKAGRCNRNIIRYNYVQNARSGFGGEYGVGIYFKANTAYTDNPEDPNYVLNFRPCEDNDAYGNIVVNAFSAFHDNHGCYGTRVYNNTAYECDRLYNQGFDNNRFAEVFNNIAQGDGSMMTYLLEFLGGVSPAFNPYVSKANYNCCFNMGTGHAFWSFGSSNQNLTAFRTTQTGVTGRDLQTITSDPLFVDELGGDFHLQAGSPCIGTGEGGVNMGAYITGSEVIGPNWT